MANPNVKIWFFGGVNEIGGTKILIEDLGYDVCVFLDFGKSFSVEKQYYSYPNIPRSLDELIRINATPDASKMPVLQGLYTQSEITKLSQQKLLELEKSNQFKEEQESNIDAIVISHAHSDHYQYISLINRNIPIHISECGYNILKIRKWIERPSLTNNLFLLNVHTFKTGQSIHVGSLKIEPVHVDHSIPASYGFIIHTSGGTVVYTGDFRFHGHNPFLTYQFHDKILENEPIDVLLTEATHVTKSILSNEDEIGRKLQQAISATERLVIADFSDTDFDRFRSYYNTAKELGRSLVVTLRQSLILGALNICEGLATPNILKDETIKILIPKREDPTKPVTGERLSSWQKIYYRHLGAEVKGSVQSEDLWMPFKEMLAKMGTPPEEKLISHAQMLNKSREYVLCPSFNTIGDLQQVKPAAGSVYVLSTSEPFDEEREIQFEKLLNWLELYGIPMLHVHVSGHVEPLDLKTFVVDVNPKRAVPIHTEKSEFFKTLFTGLGINVELPRLGSFIEL